MATFAPTTTDELCDVIAGAARAGGKLEICGGGSKRGIGNPRDADLLDMRGFADVIDYDPRELVLTVGAGTPLAEVEALVAGERQMLAFDPFDHGPMLGQGAGRATIGGVIAAGVSGSRRVSAGGARDQLLGFEAVSGRAERFVAGGRVVKNVTGYDLPKLLAGSWGRLAALTVVTLKVLPAPRVVTTCMLRGLEPAQAWAAMARALGSQAGPAAAAHLPFDGGQTLLRLEGVEASVSARLALLRTLLADFGSVESLDADLWDALRTLAPLGTGGALWRISIPARAAPRVVAKLESGRWLMDWAGGLIWTRTDADPAAIRALAAEAGGHAMLMGARPGVPTFQPQPSALAALENRVRRAFDPAGLFATGRFGDAADAH